MYGYIYETTNLINGKQYIGRKKSEEFDPTYKGSGKILWRAIHKYGWDNFSVRMLFPCFSEEELNAEEEFLIEYFDCVASDHYYNRYPGGHGGFPAGEFSPNYGRKQSESTIKKRVTKLRGRTRTERSRLRISKSVSNYYSSLSDEEKLEYNKKRADARRGKPSNFRGHHFSDESRMKMKESLSGANHPLYGKYGPDNPNYGKSRTAEQRAKISEGKRGKKRVYRPDGKYIMADPSEVESYLNQGYVLRKSELR